MGLQPASHIVLLYTANFGGVVGGILRKVGHDMALTNIQNLCAAIYPAIGLGALMKCAACVSGNR